MTSENIVWHKQVINKKLRSAHKKQKPCLVWITGLSASGKSTVANSLEKKLHLLGKHTYLLDGDNVRYGLCKDLGFTDSDRVENIRRVGELSKLFVDAGLITISAFISPFKSDRQMVRSLFEVGEYIEVYCDTPLDECERRDPKGLYRKSRDGVIKNFTGVDSPYEAPVAPEVHLKYRGQSAEELSSQVMEYLKNSGYLE